MSRFVEFFGLPRIAHACSTRDVRACEHDTGTHRTCQGPSTMLPAAFVFSEKALLSQYPLNGSSLGIRL
jgi:hypothetical protein